MKFWKTLFVICCILAVFYLIISISLVGWLSVAKYGMILSFKKTFPWGDPTYFLQKIQGQWNIPGIKAHTFRLGDRWKPGNKIHFWLGSPRNPGNGPMPFNLADPCSAVYWFDVKSDQILHRDLVPRYQKDFHGGHKKFIPLVYATEEFTIGLSARDTHPFFRLKVGRVVFANHHIYPKGMDRHNFNEAFKYITYRDGFNHAHDFIRWFWLYREKGKHVELKGRVIHWNDEYLYDPKTAKIFQP